jgi:hypothetical protein
VTDYAAYPDHPLNGVPQAVLDAARQVTADAVREKDLDPDVADALADAVVMAVLPPIRDWLGHDE